MTVGVRKKTRPIIVALAAVLLTILPFLIVGVVELGGRVIIWARHGVPGHTYGIYTSHPTLGGILKPLGYNTAGKVTNGQAFQRRQEASPNPPADRARVIAYGGSTVFAYNLPTDLDWPQLVETKAAAAGRKLEVLNAGDINWTIHHALERSRSDIPAFKPDIVIIYEGVNEERNYQMLVESGVDLKAMMDNGQYTAFSRFFPQAGWLYRNSILFKFFDQIVAPAIHNALQIGTAVIQANHDRTDPDVVRFFKGAVVTAVEEWRASGARVIYVTQAHGLNTPYAKRLTSYSREGAETARQHGALVLDAQEVVTAYRGDPMDLFISSGVHWSEKGSHLVAQYVFEQVEKADGWRIDRKR